MADEKEKKPKGLTGKERAFVTFYLGKAYFNATAAARLAGYSNPHANGWEILRRPHVSAAIEAELAKAGVTKDRVLSFLSDIAAGPSAYIIPTTDHGSFDIQQMVEDGKGHLIRGFKEIPSKFGTIYQVEMHDAAAANALLARILNLDKGSGEQVGVEVTVKVLRGVSMDDL